MMFNFFLARVTISLCFFFSFLVVFNNFFMIPIVKENTNLKLALAIPTRVSIILEMEIVDIRRLFADKIIKILLV